MFMGHFSTNTQITEEMLVLIANKLNLLKIPQVKGHFTHGITHMEHLLPLPSELHPILFKEFCEFRRSFSTFILSEA